MPKFAVIETGGKQYRVLAGQKIQIEKLDAQDGGNFTFDKVLLVADGEKVEIGTPYIPNGKVEGKILGQIRDDKKIIFKYHSKTRYRKKKGHRQRHTEVEITRI